MASGAVADSAEAPAPRARKEVAAGLGNDGDA